VSSAGADKTIEQHQLQLIALDTDAMRIPILGSFCDTQRASRSGIFQGALYCALKYPKGLLKLLILLVAGAGFEPATFGL
jgi:hypothetical protein